ncbi:Metallo-dependent phosphatase-like protein [Nemania sp. NC0429]|nr:Metallo-dependent phosphatase-like protein [Nemania sp. NC0429]
MRARLLLSAAAAAAVVAAQTQAFAHGGGGEQKPLFDPEGGHDVSGPGGLGLGLGLGAGVHVDTPPNTQSGPASCAVCETTLLQLKVAAARGDDFFVALATRACKQLKIADDDVCEGSVALEGPILAHSLRGLKVGSKTSRLICVALFGLCSFPDVEEYDVPFPSPKPERRRPGPSGQSPLRVVHYSDIHIDPWYTEGADANCTKFICCRNYADGPTPGEEVRPAGPNGEHTCDSPLVLEQSMYKAIRRLVPDAAFSIFTGDIVDHAVWNTTMIQNTLDVTRAYDRMAAAGMLVYGAVGNHEASPANSYPPLAVSSSMQWLYDVLSSSWTRWVGTRAVDTTRVFGAFSAKYPRGNLRVISLSTNLYYIHNYWLYEEPMERDPSGQLGWLVGELDAAEKAGERVYIIGHMAPGARDAFHDASNYFDQIVNRYEATIAGLFFGHTHIDEFEISYSDYSKRTADNAVAVSYIGPSMTPTSGHPAFRVYDIDPVTFGVLDVTTYIANMSDASFQGAEGPIWTKYYSARDVYGGLVDPPLAPLGETLGEDEEKTNEGIRELDAAFWHQVTERFEEDPAAFEAFFTRRRRGWQSDACDDGACKSAEICKLRAARAQDNCIPPGSVRLMDAAAAAAAVAGETPATKVPEHECGDAVLADTLGGLARNAEMRAWLEMLPDSVEMLG